MQRLNAFIGVRLHLDDPTLELRESLGESIFPFARKILRKVRSDQIRAWPPRDGKMLLILGGGVSDLIGSDVI